MKVAIVFGTRPEAVKFAPLIKAFQMSGVELCVCSTGQHREMLKQVLDVFQIEPDIDLQVMRAGQGLADLTSELILKLRDTFTKVKPDWVFVQGDTTTAMTAALAAFYEKIPVAHVEAGLRTGSLTSPWPEEGNRRLIGSLAELHFAPTEHARANLLREGVAENRVFTTGNTVIDALLMARARLESSFAEPARLRQELERKFSFLDPSKKLILVTGHRRESFGEGFRQICMALKEISLRPDVQILYPVHLNPNVRGVVYETLSDRPNIHLIEPLEYLSFVFVMAKAHLILTDSGGVQEEAPSLGKPVLVMRDRTERPEALLAGTSELVGTLAQTIVRSTARLLDQPAEYDRRCRIANPFGDGSASRQIVDILFQYEQRQQSTVLQSDVELEG